MDSGKFSKSYENLEVDYCVLYNNRFLFGVLYRLSNPMATEFFSFRGSEITTAVNSY